MIHWPDNIAIPWYWALFPKILLHLQRICLLEGEASVWFHTSGPCDTVSTLRCCLASWIDVISDWRIDCLCDRRTSLIDWQVMFFLCYVFFCSFVLFCLVLFILYRLTDWISDFFSVFFFSFFLLIFFFFIFWLVKLQNWRSDIGRNLMPRAFHERLLQDLFGTYIMDKIVAV